MSKSPVMDVAKDRGLTMSRNTHNVNHVHYCHLLQQHETCSIVSIIINVLHQFASAYKYIDIYDMSGLGDIKFISNQELFESSNLIYRDNLCRVILEKKLPGSVFFLLSLWEKYSSQPSQVGSG